MTANVNSNLASWSTTESSNSPAGTDTSDIDAEFRMIQKVVRQYLASKGADIASGATVDLSAATGNYVHVTGTTTITALGTVSAGMRFMLVFDGALTFTHNATSLILPGAANITTAAGDRCEVVSLGSGNWRCFWFTRASGLPVVGSYLPLAGGTMTGDITMSGASIFDANASIAAHATTMDPWSLGNYVTLTGAAVNFTAMVAAPQAGAEVELYMNAAHTFTDGAVFEVDGNANYTAAAGDRVLLRAKSTTVFTVHPRKADGTAVVSSGLSAASQAQQETASSNAVAVTPGTQHFHPSAAKAYAFVRLSGGTPTVTTGYNIASITDNGTGDWTINFTTAFSTADFICVGTAYIATPGARYFFNIIAKTVSSVRVQVWSETDGSLLDSNFDIVCFGDF